MAIEKAELKFEDDLIHKLETLGGVKQWKYEPSQRNFGTTSKGFWKKTIKINWITHYLLVNFHK